MSCIFIFRRDLRLTDNTTLIAALNKYDKVLPVFIYDVNQLTLNGFHNTHFLTVQEQALDDLNSYLTKKNSMLLRMYGTPYKVIDYLIKCYHPAAVAFNLDYSDYSRQRDSEIARVVSEHKLELLCLHDYYIFRGTVDKTLKYTRLFSDFMVASLNENVNVQKNNISKFDKFVPKIYKTAVPIKLPRYSPPVTATRAAALERIKNNTSDFQISCHLKLGLISGREVYKYAVLNNLDYLRRQLTWRDYYLAVHFHFRNIYHFYDERYVAIKWRNDSAECKLLWTGQTGFVLVDAAMRELNETGLMHNRYRLIVGFFSVKILRINPFWIPENPEHEWHMGGQMYFSKKLIDACYINNTANWHFVASDILDASGQRFGHGWSGRSYSLKPKPEDAEYLRKWQPKKCELMCDAKMRWQEWRSMTI